MIRINYIRIIKISCIEVKQSLVMPARLLDEIQEIDFGDRKKIRSRTTGDGDEKQGRVELIF